MALFAMCGCVGVLVLLFIVASYIIAKLLLEE